MEQWLDLHMHSNVSNDGEFSPEQLMFECNYAQLKVVALADHNSVRGVKKARLGAMQQGMTLISGIELDCQCEGHNLHLLGYGIDEEREIFAEIEANVEQQERGTSKQRIALVRAQGIWFEDAAVMALAINGIVTGEMIAEVALVDHRNAQNPLLAPYRPGGSRSDNPYVNFYWDFCAQGKPAYVPMDFIALSRAVEIVREAGGVAVLAHPGANIGTNRALLDRIRRSGIQGIEVYSSYHDAATIRFYNEYVSRENLLATVGSDFHGKTKPAIHLGEIGAAREADLLRRLQTQIEQVRNV